MIIKLNYSIEALPTNRTSLAEYVAGTLLLLQQTGFNDQTALGGLGALGLGPGTSRGNLYFRTAAGIIPFNILDYTLDHDFITNGTIGGSYIPSDPFSNDSKMGVSTDFGLQPVINLPLVDGSIRLDGNNISNVSFQGLYLQPAFRTNPIKESNITLANVMPVPRIRVSITVDVPIQQAPGGGFIPTRMMLMVAPPATGIAAPNRVVNQQWTIDTILSDISSTLSSVASTANSEYLNFDLSGAIAGTTSNIFSGVVTKIMSLAGVNNSTLFTLGGSLQF